MKNHLILALALATGHPMTHAQTPPQAEKHPHTVHSPHGDRQDEYYWLRDDTRQNPQILAYLQAENAYTDAIMQPLKTLQDRLYNENLARLKQHDSTVPVLDHGHWYYTRYETDREYPIYARRPAQANRDALSLQQQNAENDLTDETLLLDLNTLAQHHDYYSAYPVDISRDNRLMIWAEDTTGRRQYTLRIKNLITGETLPDHLLNTSGDALWADDNRTLLYIENDPDTLLTTRVKTHTLGSDPANDPTLYEETDDSYYISLARTRDQRYLLIHLENTLESETRYTPADQPHTLKTLSPREHHIEYQADHFNGHWIIRTNADNAYNYKIMTAADHATERPHWQEWIAHHPDTLIEDLEHFDTYTALSERSGGLTRIRIVKQDGTSHHLTADENAYTMHLGANPDPTNPNLRYHYSSLTTPPTTYEHHTASGNRRTLKQDTIPGYHADRYQTERLTLPARDGTPIPVTLAYRRDLPRNGTAPLLQYGYGSYGHTIDPEFDPDIISLLDRGILYAIAHIRGGQDMGRHWYDNGKMHHKQNTFTDFIDITRGLIARQYAAPDRIAALGGSAGGLLMGVIANTAPENYRVILTQVPFVDIVTTMLDPTIPLTTNEYDEWGNPEASAEDYAYMLAYSPYDNLKTQHYPAIYITTGLWDSQVQYWEPAKYTARLRERNTGPHPILLRTQMDAGHSGQTGRFRAIREQAEMYAFMLWQLGIMK